MASSRKIDDFSSYQDFILFLTTSPQQLHGAHRARARRICMSPRAAAGSIHDHACRGARRPRERAIDACMAGPPVRSHL
jgi:hypothetical protein